MSDWRLMVEAMTIKTKDAKYRKLGELWPQQAEVGQSVADGDDTTVLKARQQGMTTVVTRVHAWEWLTTTDPLELAIVSYKQRSASHLLLEHIRTVWESLPPLIRPPLAIDRRDCLQLRDTGAKYSAYSAESAGGIRSYTFQRCLLTEFDHSRNPGDMLSSVEAALNHNPLVIETTASHYGSAMHTRVQGLQAGRTPGRLFFYGWQDHPLYRRPVPEDFVLNDAEHALQRRYKLDLEQIAWYRWKLGRQGSLRKMQREYPSCIEDAFGSAGNSYFEKADLQNTRRLHWPVDEARAQWLDPDPLDAYAIGVDCAAGRGGDPTAYTVLSKKQHAHAAAHTATDVGPTKHAQLLHAEGYRYATRVPGRPVKPALIVVESNGEWGAKTLNALRELGYPEACLYTNDEGKEWVTDKRSRITAYEGLRDAWHDGLLETVPDKTEGQVWSVLLDDKGVRPEVPDDLPHHADLVVSDGLAWQGLLQVRLPPRSVLPAWIEQEELDRVRGSHPFARSGRY